MLGSAPFLWSFLRAACKPAAGLRGQAASCLHSQKLQLCTDRAEILLEEAREGAVLAVP